MIANTITIWLIKSLVGVMGVLPRLRCVGDGT